MWLQPHGKQGSPATKERKELGHIKKGPGKGGASGDSVTNTAAAEGYGGDEVVSADSNSAPVRHIMGGNGTQGQQQ